MAVPVLVPQTSSPRSFIAPIVSPSSATAGLAKIARPRVAQIACLIVVIVISLLASLFAGRGSVGGDGPSPAQFQIVAALLSDRRSVETTSELQSFMHN